MVREREPARHPLAPSMGNSAPPAKPLEHDKQKTQDPLPDLAPQFGQPSALGLSPQPYSRTQPLVRPGPNPSTTRQVSGTHGDKYSNLFVPSKKPVQRPELHKPHVVANPLQAFRDIRPGQPQSTNPTASRRQLDDDEDEVFKIAMPTNNYPSWQHKPVPHQTFSAPFSANPYIRPKPLADMTRDTSNELPAWKDSRQDDFFSSTDPFTYMDAGKANENIKALLEGAFEDEDDKPRTRRKKKALDQKLDDLAAKMEGMSVKNQAQPNKEEEEEEEEEDVDDGVIPGLTVKLLPHQIDGVNWMRDKETGTKKTRGVLPKGGILADDMGLGKTIQSIALILSNRRPTTEQLAETKKKLPEGISHGTLVVAPLALIKQWEGELKDRVEKTHTLKVCVHHGPGRTKDFNDLKKYDVVITTYQTLSSEHAGSEGSQKVGCFGVHWFRVILDEAHSIKNRNAKATKAACALRSEYRWCLSGTPMQNNLDELQSLIHFLQIKPYDDLNTWREQITKPMNNGKGGLALRRLQVYLKAFMKRRTKDILKQDGALRSGKGSGSADKGKDPGFKIVARTVEKVEAEFTEQEREFYQRLESRTDKSLEMMMAGNKMSYASALVLLMRLRQACNHPKLTGSDLSNEKDAFTGSQTPSRRKGSTDDDMDSIANMLGGLSVQTKRCDVCQIELSGLEAANGAIRCTECEEDLNKQSADVKAKKPKRQNHAKKEKKVISHQRNQAHRIVVDSDDEEEEEDDDDDDDTNEATSEEDENTSSEDEDESSTSEPHLLQSTKIRHLIQILKSDAHNNKYIVFSFFTSMLDLIEPFLRSNRIRFVRYDGKMRNDAREASLNSLRSDPSTRVLLCSLRAGSLGLNLTAASRVVILEPFWNPFVEEQAIDRVHRLNQTTDVKVYKLTIKDTVEARILELQDKKRELANATIEGRKGAMKLTLQDMLKLFGRDAEREHHVEVPAVQKANGRPQEMFRHQNAASAAAQAPDNRSSTHSASTSRSSTISGQGASGHGGSNRPREKIRISDPNKVVRKEHEVYGRRW